MTRPPPSPENRVLPHYLLAEEDLTFIKRPELRPVRLQLELLKPELLLAEHKVVSTLVVFGGTQILERPEAQQRLDALQASVAVTPEEKAIRERDIARAERILAKSHYYDAARD